LASNGLLEALVFARTCAEGIAKALPEKKKSEEVEIDFATGGTAVDESAVTELREAMTAHVGVRRNADGLEAALKTIARLEAEQAHCPTFRNMAATATLIAAAALKRTESRGGHHRDDYPDSDPNQAERTRITLAEAIAIRDQISKA
jgi:L-aspartate oxidase